MTYYMFKREDGAALNWLGDWEVKPTQLYVVPEELKERVIAKYGGHAAPLTEATEVTPKQADTLRGLIQELGNGDTLRSPYEWVGRLARAGLAGEELEDILFAGYTSGPREKRYRVRVPKSWCGGEKEYFYKSSADDAITMYHLGAEPERAEFTQAEIDKYGLDGFELEEVE